MQVGWSCFVLALALTAVRCDVCYTCTRSEEDVLACGDEYLTSCGSYKTSTVTDLIKLFLPEIEEIFTVWPPTGNSQCLKTLIRISGIDRIFYGCTNLGQSTCSKLQGSVQAAGGTLKQCHLCSEDKCNECSVTAVSLLLLIVSIVACIINQ